MARALSLSLMEAAPPSSNSPPPPAAGECDCHVT